MRGNDATVAEEKKTREVWVDAYNELRDATQSSLVFALPSCCFLFRHVLLTERLEQKKHEENNHTKKIASLFQTHASHQYRSSFNALGFKIIDIFQNKIS